MIACNRTIIAGQQSSQVGIALHKMCRHTKKSTAVVPLANGG